MLYKKGLSYEYIANSYGFSKAKRTHATVLIGVKAIDELIETNQLTINEIEMIKELI